MADFETVHDALDHTGLTGVGGGGGAGTVLQVVTAVSSTDDTTTNTSASPATSSLSATITPVANDSILIISVDGEASAARASGSPTGRYLHCIIYNSTDAVTVTNQRRGRVLIAGSTAAATELTPIALRGRYTVNSTAARTFQLRFYTITDLTCSILGATSGPALMTITEVAV